MSNIRDPVPGHIMTKITPFSPPWKLDEPRLELYQPSLFNTSDIEPFDRWRLARLADRFYYEETDINLIESSVIVRLLGTTPVQLEVNITGCRVELETTPWTYTESHPCQPPPSPLGDSSQIHSNESVTHIPPTSAVGHKWPIHVTLWYTTSISLTWCLRGDAC